MGLSISLMKVYVSEKRENKKGNGTKGPLFSDCEGRTLL